MIDLEQSSAPEPGKTLLLVDDEPTIRYVLGLVFQAAGYQCLFASDAEEGLAVFRQHQSRIDGVLTDIHMPGRDGFDLVRDIRSIDPEVKVLLCSGKFSEGDPRIPSDLAVSGFIAKPFTTASLVGSVEQLVGTPN